MFTFVMPRAWHRSSIRCETCLFLGLIGVPKELRIVQAPSPAASQCNLTFDQAPKYTIGYFEKSWSTTTYLLSCEVTGNSIRLTPNIRKGLCTGIGVNSGLAERPPTVAMTHSGQASKNCMISMHIHVHLSITSAWPVCCRDHKMSCIQCICRHGSPPLFVTANV